MKNVVNVRAVVVNERQQILLVNKCLDMQQTKDVLWEVIDCALHPDLNHSQAIERKLRNEIRAQAARCHQLIWFGGKNAVLNGVDVFVKYYFYFVKVEMRQFHSAANVQNGSSSLGNCKWWSYNDIASSHANFLPNQLGALFRIPIEDNMRVPFSVVI